MKLLGLLAIAFLVAPCLASWGYTNAYQGLAIEFAAVRWNGYMYTAEQTGPNPNYECYYNRGGQFWVESNLTVSACQFNDRLNFDPDKHNDGLPNIMGASQPVSVDTTVNPKMWNWTIYDQPQVHQATYNGDDYNVTTQVKREFKMLRFKCDWSVNLYLGGDHLEAYPQDYTHYNDVEVIMRVKPSNFVYFTENPAQMYVAPAYICLSEQPVWTSINVQSFQSVFPGAKGETLGVYYNLDGSTQLTETKLLTYEGFQLDPLVFRDEYYIRLGLDSFMPVTTWGLFHADWFEEMPSVTLNFLVYTFVVGEWEVMLESWEKIELEQHQSQERDKPSLTPKVEAKNLPPEWVWLFRGGVFISAVCVILWIADKLKLRENAETLVRGS